MACIGSNNMDIIMTVDDVLRFELFDKEKIKKYTAIEYSSKLNVKSIKLAPGGSAANIAVDSTYLGIKPAYIGKLGDDSPGEECVEDLKKHGVNTEGVIVSDEIATGMSVILITPYGKDRSILAYKGANNYITPDEINTDLLDRSRSLVWTSLTSDSSIAAIERCIDHVKADKKMVYAAPSISILAHQTEQAVELVRKSDILSVNKSELQAITGEPNIHFSLEKALKLGPKIVACTNGKEGSFITDGKDIIEAPVYEIEVMDTTGAGDAFITGLIYSCMHDWELSKTVTFATAFSAFECMALGVREGFPKKVETILKYIEENPLKLHESSF